MKDRFKLGQFWSTVITLIVVYGLVKWVVPFVCSRDAHALLYGAHPCSALYLHLIFRGKASGVFSPYKKTDQRRIRCKHKDSGFGHSPACSWMAGIFNHSPKGKLANIPKNPAPVQQLPKNNGATGKTIEKP